MEAFIVYFGAVFGEIYNLRCGIVEDRRIILCLNLVFVGFIRLVGIVVGDLEFHLVEKLRWIQDFADDKDRLSTQIREEGDGRQREDSRQTWCANEILNGLLDIKTVITTRVIAGIAEEG